MQRPFEGASLLRNKAEESSKQVFCWRNDELLKTIFDHGYVVDNGCITVYY